MKLSLIHAFPLALLAFAAPAVAQQANQDFTLNNRTGYEIKEVYVSPASAGDWQEDVLGNGTLADENGANIHFNAKTSTCKWDLKVVYTDDGSSAVWGGIDLCQVARITIKYDRKSDTTSATFE